jgi:hypothetical protein
MIMFHFLKLRGQIKAVKGLSFTENVGVVDSMWLVGTVQARVDMTIWSVESNVNRSAVKTSPPVMESEGSLSCSQESATGPYPEPGESNLQLFTLFL